MNKSRKPHRIPEFDSESARAEFYRGRALHFLEFKMRTEAEVRRYLQEWQCPDLLIQEIIDFLTDYRYIDDAQYVRSFLRQERELHHRSRKDITYRLLEKGISPEQIAQGFEEEAEDAEDPASSELQAVRILIRKRIGSGPFDRNKLIAYLQRKGFSYGTIRSALLEISSEEAEDLPDPMEEGVNEE